MLVSWEAKAVYPTRETTELESSHIVTQESVLQQHQGLMLAFSELLDLSEMWGG